MILTSTDAEQINYYRHEDEVIRYFITTVKKILIIFYKL